MLIKNLKGFAVQFNQLYKKIFLSVCKYNFINHKPFFQKMQYPYCYPTYPSSVYQYTQSCLAGYSNCFSSQVSAFDFFISLEKDKLPMIWKGKNKFAIILLDFSTYCTAHPNLSFLVLIFYCWVELIRTFLFPIRIKNLNSLWIKSLELFSHKDNWFLSLSEY